MYCPYTAYPTAPPPLPAVANNAHGVDLIQCWRRS